MASGNGAIVARDMFDAAIVADPTLAECRNALTIVDVAVRELIDRQHAGIVADGEVRQEVANILAKKPGAIVPLLSVSDDLERFFHEQTLTIDTTAAGGNASLLAMQPFGAMGA
jgi:delta 1-pyrroline-5-carboxylate dehydrogenase